MVSALETNEDDLIICDACGRPLKQGIGDSLPFQVELCTPLGAESYCFETEKCLRTKVASMTSDDLRFEDDYDGEILPLDPTIPPHPGVESPLTCAACSNTAQFDVDFADAGGGHLVRVPTRRFG